MSVHYKFKSALEYDTVTFDGLHISVRDLKNAIVQQKRIGKNTDFDLQVTNAQTKEIYANEEALIPKNTSLLIARVPSMQSKPKTWEGYGGNNSPSTRVDDSGPVGKAVDLASLDASEEDKIKAMMSQSTQDYDPSNYMKIRGSNQMGAVPANYRCFKCHQGGHWIKDCPLSLGPDPIEIKKSTGIPRSFMVPVDGPQVPGAMMTPNGSFAVPLLDQQAYNEKPQPAAPADVKRTEIPDDLLCSICTDLLTDAVMIPCCGNSFCDECIRSCLLESEEHECPDCHERNISPGTLIPNRFLRTAVGNFKNTTGYVKRPVHKAAAPATTPITTTPVVERAQSPIEQESACELETKATSPPPAAAAAASTTASAKSEVVEKPVISEADSTEPPKVAVETATTETEDVTKVTPPPSTEGPPGVSPKREQSPPPQKITSVIDRPRNAVSEQRQCGPRDRSPRRPRHMHRSPSYDKHRQRMEDRPGTPTVDEPGVGGLSNIPPIVFVGPPPYSAGPPPVLPVMGLPPGLQVPPPMAAAFPGTNQPPPTYQPPPPIQPNFRLPPPGMGGPYLPNPYPTNRSMFDTRPPHGSLPTQNYSSNFNAGPRLDRDFGRDMRRQRTPPGIIDDPLEAFNRMLREKDERERRAKQRKARSYSRSSSRSFSRSPYRMRSRSPRRRISRSRSRSFSISRSRSRSFSPNLRMSPVGRQFSPKHSPHRSGHSRYRSPARNSPPRYRYKETNQSRDRGGYAKDDRSDYRERDYQYDYGYERDRERDRERERGGRARWNPAQRKDYQGGGGGDHYYPSDAPSQQQQQQHSHHQQQQQQHQHPPLMMPSNYGPSNRYPPRDYPNQHLPPASIGPLMAPLNLPPPPLMRRPYDEVVVPPGTEPPVPGLDTPRFDARFPYDTQPPPATNRDTRMPETNREERKVSKSPETKTRSETKTTTKERESRRHTSPDRHRKKRSETVEHSKQDGSDDEKSKKSKEKKRRKEKKESERRKRREKREKREHEKRDKDRVKEGKEEKVKEESKKKLELPLVIVEQDSEGRQDENETIPLELPSREEAAPKIEATPPAHLYDDIPNEGIDATVVENYGKMQQSPQTELLAVEQQSDVPKSSDVVPVAGIGEEVRAHSSEPEEDFETDVLDLQTNEAELKVDIDKHEVLAPMPEKSRWEIDEEAVTPTTPDSREDSRSSDRGNDKAKVTNEVLKRAENAIFAKAINAIRPIEIKKISLDRVKLYASERDDVPVTGNIHVTIPCTVDDATSKTTSVDTAQAPSAPPTTTKPRLSVKERLGCKVDDLERIVKVEKTTEREQRMRSHSLSPLSRRAGELNRNLGQGERRNEEHMRRTEMKRHRDGPVMVGQHRSLHRGDARSSREEPAKERRGREARHHRDEVRKASRERKEEKKVESKGKKSRSKSVDREKERRKRRDKKDKRKDRTKKPSKRDEEEEEEEEEEDGLRSPSAPPPTVIKATAKEAEPGTPSRILERRKPTLDEANFVPDYDLESDAEHENATKKSVDEKKSKKRSSSPPLPPPTTTATVNAPVRDELPKKRKVEVRQSTSDESSDSSSTDERKRKKHRKHKKKKRSRTSSSSDSDSDSSENEKDRKRKKHKKSKKKKKKSKHK